MQGHALPKRQIIIKLDCQLLKIFFSRTTGPISTKLGTEHHWVKGIQVCWNEGPHLSQRGDSWEIEKTHWKLFKIFFSRTTGTLMTKRYKSSYSIFLYEGPTPHQRGDNYKIVKMHWQIIKFSSTELDKFWHKAYWGKGDLFFFKSMAKFF